jgi:coatomer protein complex subunit epsilon
MCINNTLNRASIQVKGLIRINRVDLAEIALKHMLDMNDDATISQLTNAYFAIAQGGQEKIEEAQIIFTELQKKLGDSSVILNGLAICALNLGAYERAERVLLNALGTAPNDPDTLVNLIVCGQHLKKGDEYTAKYLSQLSSVSPRHPWLKKYNELDSDFDSAALAYSA